MASVRLPFPIAELEPLATCGDVDVELDLHLGDELRSSRATALMELSA